MSCLGGAGKCSNYLSSVGTEYAILQNQNLLFHKLRMCPVQWSVLNLQHVLPYIIQTVMFLC